MNTINSNSLLFHRMAGVGTNSAELRAIRKNRSKLVTAIAKQGGLNWFSQKLQELDFITLERASGLTGTLGVSDEDKVSSLLEAVEAKIKSNRQGTPFSDFVKMLEDEGCFQDLGQTLQIDCQMFKEASRSDDVVSGQIPTSMSEAKPSVSIRDSPADSSGDMTTIPSSTRPAPFPMRSVDGSGQVYVPVKNTFESDTDVADGGEIPTLQAELPTGHQPVDDSAPSAMVPVQQTSALTRAKDLHEYVGAELSAISGDVTKKDSQISDLKEQLQKHLQQEDKRKQRDEEQEKQITDLTEEKKKLKTVVQEKTEELTQTKKQLAEKACKLEECEQKLNLERQTKEQLQQQLDEKTTELESSRKQLANKEREFEEVRIDKDKEIAELREALEEKTKEVEDQEEQVTELRAERDNLNMKLVEKENELLKAQLELAQKGEKLAKTETELTQLQNEKKLEELRISSERELEEQCRNSKKELEDQRRSSEKELEDQRRSSEKELEDQRRGSEKELEDQRRGSEEYRRNSEATIAIKDAKIAELEEKFSKMQHSDKDTTS